jgi:L-iditol 2-dehydrogenase
MQDSRDAETMAAARLYGSGDLRLVREPRPRVYPGASLVRMTVVGVCGSDLHWFEEAGIGDARLDAPLVLGHELAGVVEAGELTGQRVAIDPAIPCRNCGTCDTGHRNLCPNLTFAGHGSTDGGLREYVAWPTSLLHPLPATISAAEAAMLEPLGVAIHALDLGHPRIGMSVGVFGTGPIGLLLIQVARASGASAIVASEPLAHRREAAARLGADVVLATGEHTNDRTATDPAGLNLDLTFEAAGTDAALVAAMQAVRPGGRVVVVGIPDNDQTSFPASLARRKGLTIVMARRMKETYPRAIDAVERGQVDLSSLVTHRFPLRQAQQAFAFARTRAGLKSVIDVTTDET